MSTRTRTYTLRTFFLACVLLSVMGTAGAQTASEYLAASERFTAKAAASSEIPRLTEPDTKALLDALSDRRLLDDRAMTADDLPMLMNVCQAGTGALMTYGLHNVRERIQAETDPLRIQAVMQEQMGANFLLYEDEVTVLMPFVSHCGARMLQVFDEFIARLKPGEFNAVRKQGLEQARRGFRQMYVGMVTAGLDPTNRLRLLQAGALDAAIYASALRVEERAEVAAVARRELASAAASLQPPLREIADAMSSTDCTGLCKR